MSDCELKIIAHRPLPARCHRALAAVSTAVVVRLLLYEGTIVSRYLKNCKIVAMRDHDSDDSFVRKIENNLNVFVVCSSPSEAYLGVDGRRRFLHVYEFTVNGFGLYFYYFLSYSQSNTNRIGEQNKQIAWALYVYSVDMRIADDSFNGQM